MRYVTGCCLLLFAPFSAADEPAPLAAADVPEDVLESRKDHAKELETQIAALEKTVNDVRRGRLRAPGKTRREHLAELREELDPLKAELADIDRWFPPLDLVECRVGDVGRVKSPLTVIRVVDEANVVGTFEIPSPANPKQTIPSTFWLTKVSTKGMQPGEPTEIDAVFELHDNDREGQLGVPELSHRELPTAEPKE